MRITVCGVIQPQRHCKQSRAPQQRGQGSSGQRSSGGSRAPGAAEKTSAFSPAAPALGPGALTLPIPGDWTESSNWKRLKSVHKLVGFLPPRAMHFLLSSVSASPQIVQLENKKECPFSELSFLDPCFFLSVREHCCLFPRLPFQLQQFR